MSYEKRQAEWLKNSGVKEGDKVLVVGVKDGWEDDAQKDTVGMVGVFGYADDAGALVRFGEECPCDNSGCNQGWIYPFYLLAKVEND
jgi:hypothetical protein